MRIRKTLLIPALVVALALIAVATAIVAEPKDGRLNLEAHFGGDALYCVDVNMNPTTVYPSDGQGGLRLLDMSGNEKWFIPAATILAKVAEATANNTGVDVASGWGTYGPAALFVFVEGGVPKFTFTGMDEHGKQNSFVFSWCDPVGKRTYPQSSGAPDCGDDADQASIGSDSFDTCSLRAQCGSYDGDFSSECFCDAYPDYLECKDNPK